MTQPGFRWHAPPGWPVPPPGWTPPPGWKPDPSWPPPPEGWQFWQRESDPATSEAHWPQPGSSWQPAPNYSQDAFNLGEWVNSHKVLTVAIGIGVVAAIAGVGLINAATSEDYSATTKGVQNAVHDCAVEYLDTIDGLGLSQVRLGINYTANCVPEKNRELACGPGIDDQGLGNTACWPRDDSNNGISVEAVLFDAAVETGDFAGFDR